MGGLNKLLRLYKNSYENIVGKGEIARKSDFSFCHNIFRSNRINDSSLEVYNLLVANLK